MNVEWISSVAVIAADPTKSRELYALLHQARKEPWGQTVARLLPSEGSIVGISYTPSQHAE
jgi:hypothetical protein